MQYTIYKITNFINDKKYIGQHIFKKECSRQYMGKGLGIREAYKKYGKENFVKEIIEIVEDNTNDRAIVSEREKYWIKELNTMEPNGYNRHPGGIGGCTKESGQKGADTRKERGYRHSEETKKKISKSHTGSKFTEEHKQHLSDNHHLKKKWIFVYENGEEKEYTGSIQDFLIQNNISFNKLVRLSYKKSFEIGFYIKDICKEDYAILRQLKEK